MRFEITREYIDELRIKIEEKNQKDALSLIVNLYPADIAEIYNELNIDEAKFLYLLLDKEKASDVLIELEEDDRERFLKVLPSDLIAKQFINEMDSDDAADIIGELPEKKQEEVLSHIEDFSLAGDIVDLLNYDENSAGGLMAKELIAVNENWSLLYSLKEMRKQAEKIDELFYVYVVNDDNILNGTLSLKRLLLAQSAKLISEIVNYKVISVKTDTSSEEVANIMKKYDLVALPVLDGIGRLVGRITIDDVIDVIKEEAEKDYQMISGISEDVEPNDSVFLLTRARLPWLLIGMIGGIFGAEAMSNYKNDLAENASLALFIPLIAAMAGNVGVQSSSIVVQGLANQTIYLGSTFKKVMKEIAVALSNGLICSSLIFIYNLIFSDSFALTLTVSISLFIVILFASTFGTFVPMALNRLKIDPAVATGPFITTVNDIIGLIIYLTIGRILFGIF
ncbi:MAG: magnesium transporter [Bacteroidetes bacterium 4572_128]|nr:MAG: magnesium transporter [Bacteroidetes bacterium 4572_128]